MTSVLTQRVLTALVLIPIVLLLVFFLPPLEFLILTGLITLAAAWEWSSLIQLKARLHRLIYLVLFVAGGAAVLFLPAVTILRIGFVWWLLVIALIATYPRMQWWRHGIWRGVMGFLVLMPCWIALNVLRNQPMGLPALFFLFLLIWGADSVAYFAGKRWGKHHLAPLISPGKTIQGVAGALLFALLLASSVMALKAAPFSFSLWAENIGLAVITVVFSIIGDLFESMLKRSANLKDSGSLLPGHGGLLDRIDSLTAAAPIFVCGAWWLSQLNA